MGGAGAIGGSRDQLTQFLGAGVPCGKDAGEIGAAVLTGADIPVLIQLYRQKRRIPEVSALPEGRQGAGRRLDALP